jgi:hypothetical protein
VIFHIESYREDGSLFDHSFSEYLNNKHDAGWDYEDGESHMEGGTRHAFCIFERETDAGYIGRNQIISSATSQG